MILSFIAIILSIIESQVLLLLLALTLADFEGPEPKNYRVTETIVQQLHEATRTYSGVKIQALTYTIRGLAYLKKGDFNSAIADFNHSLKLKPDLALAYNNRGLAYLIKGNAGCAIADFLAVKTRLYANFKKTVEFSNTQSCTSE